jgi:hypothetical protein
MSTSNRDLVSRKHQALVAELTESGELLNGAGLAYPADTKTIQLKDGVGIISNEPFVRANEQLTTYYLIDSNDLDRALSLSERLLDFHVLAVEVRPVHDSVGM